LDLLVLDDPRCHHASHVAAKRHTPGECLFALGAQDLHGAVQIEGYPGQEAQVLKQGESGEKDDQGGQHDGNYCPYAYNQAIHQSAGHPPGGLNTHQPCPDGADQPGEESL
jgi:hypothetical protein